MAAALAVLWGVPIALPLPSAFGLPLPVAWCLPSLFVLRLPLPFEICHLPFDKTEIESKQNGAERNRMKAESRQNPRRQAICTEWAGGLGLGLGLELLFEAPFFHTLRLHPVAGARAEAVGRSQK